MTTTERGERWIEYVPLEEILRAPRNPKTHNAQMIAQSMDRFGVVEVPALDERTGRLVAGHGRLDEWERARADSKTPPEGVKTASNGRWLVPVSRGWASRDDAEAEAYLITSNTSVISGGWDDRVLNEVLTSIAQEDFSLAQLTGYPAAELDRLLEAAETSTDLPPEAFEPQASLAEGDTPADPGSTQAPAPWLPHWNSDQVVEHDDVPATDARYAETPEQEATRSERIASYARRQGGDTGLIEMILVYGQADRAEVARLVAEARNVLGADLKASEIVLRALRTMSAVLDNRESPDAVPMKRLAMHTGWTPEQ